MRFGDVQDIRQNRYLPFCNSLSFLTKNVDLYASAPLALSVEALVFCSDCILTENRA